MLRRLISLFLPVFLLAIPLGAWAGSAKIDLGDGQALARAQAGERVRVNVEFSIGDVAIPRTEAQRVQRRAVIKQQRDNLLAESFGAEETGFLNRTVQPFTETGSTRPVLVRKLDNVPGFTMKLTLPEMEKLAQNPKIIRISEDHLSKPFLDESIPLIGANTVWAGGTTGFGYAVAVLDTGSDISHVMFNGKIAGSACFSTTDVASQSTSLCPDGTDEQIGGDAGTNCAVEGTDAVDGCLHGTHVASIAVGAQANYTTTSGTRTIAGVAKGAKLVAIQVFSRIDDNSASGCDGKAPCALSYNSDQMAGLDYVLTHAVDMSIASANMSLGGGKYTAYCDSNSLKSLVDSLRAANVATAIASGNESYTNAISSPSCISTAVTVGSTTKQDAVSSFSNSADMVDLLAPGSQIFGAYPGNRAVTLSGTSMATPHVAGAFALLRSGFPSATVSEIEDAMKATGKMIVDPRNGIAKPRIRVDLAYDFLSGGSGIGNIALTPVEGYFGSGTFGEPASFSTKVYTLTNNGSSSADWSVAGDKTWLVFDQTSGSLAAGASTTVTVSINSDNIPSENTDTGTITFTSGANTTIRSAAVYAKVPVINDDFADALPLTGLAPMTTGTSVGASKETGEPSHGGNSGGASVWYKWTPWFSGDVNVSLNGSDFDTTLGIYTGSSVDSLSTLAQNDDEDYGGGIYTSLASFTATAGTTYYIAIDGYGGASGNYALAVSPATAPGNDNFANADMISGDSGSSSGFNRAATAETGEPMIAGSAAAHSVWYSWTAPFTGGVQFETSGSAIDTRLGVFTGSSVDALTEVKSNDDADSPEWVGVQAQPTGDSAVLFHANSGTTYHIAIDDKASDNEGGIVRLAWYPQGQYPLFATSVLPNARSVQVGSPATAFMTAINAGTTGGQNCFMSLLGSSFEGAFTYQTTDSLNVATGTINTPVDIAQGASQSFVFSVTPSVEVNEEELYPVVACENSGASDVTTGVSTFDLSASKIEPQDMLTIAASPSADGVIWLGGLTGSGFAVVATSAIGASGQLTFSANDGGASLPLAILVCETNPADSTCLTAPSSSVTFSSVNGETRTFAMFVSGTGTEIPFNAATNRIFLQFKDSGDVTRGGSSLAITTNSAG